MISQLLKSQKFIIVTALVLIAGILVFLFYDRPVATIGNWKIYQKDIDYRDKIIQLEFPEEKRSVGLIQLKKSATHLAILNNYDVQISDEQIAAEEARIEARTRNPEQLAKIKSIFGDDKEAYRKNFVLPVLVDRMIYYDFFANNQKIHEESLKSATELIKASVDQPAKFREVAAERKMNIQELVISLRDGLTWKNTSDQARASGQSQPNEPPMKIENADVKNKKLYEQIQKQLSKTSKDGFNEDAQQWYTNVIRQLEVGQVSPVPLNREDAFVVAKFAKQISPEKFSMEVVIFPKLEYGQWLEQEKQKVLR